MEGWYASGSPGDPLELILSFLTGTTRRYIIGAEDASLIHIGGTLTGVDELMETIQERTFNSREERAMAVLQAEMDAQFGSVSVNLSKGINKGGKWYAWQKVRCVSGAMASWWTFRVPSSTITFTTGGLLNLDDEIASDLLPNGDVLYSLVARRDDWIRLNATKIESAGQDVVEH